MHIYQEEVEAGRSLVLVRASTYTAKRASEIMAKHGVIDIRTRRPRVYRGNAGDLDAQLCYDIDTLPAVRETRRVTFMELLPH
ncbi:MAG: hypothetical protein HC828_07045 [Blastochloris sp.]|nr:hypothetical protein [Blastochloris sp.]